MRLHLLFLLAFFCCASYTAQNEYTKWHFGGWAGLDFMTSPPTSIPSPTMLAVENSASIADAAGNLLFYTNSENIWDASHQVMANGSGLLGNFSTTQSMIVKRPGSASEYYVFHIDEEGGPDGLRYSTVDMSLAAGMGSVTVKNVLMYTPSSEKLCAVRHCNGTDIWVLTHDYSGNNFKAFLVTAAGVGLSPVVTAIGTSYYNAGINMGGPVAQMKFSPNGRKVGVAMQFISQAAITGGFELFDFDNSTGVLSNMQALGTATSAAYGCEFSPDGTKFYGTLSITSRLIQWDLCTGNNASVTIPSQFPAGPGNYFTSLQLAPDGKIYLSRSGTTLGVITSPNAAGVLCNYSDAGPYLAPYGNMQPGATNGLPGFPAHPFLDLPAPTFTYSENCQTATFTPAPQICFGSGLLLLNRSWNFGDPASGTANASSLTFPSHTYQAPGTYTVKLITYYTCHSDTAILPVTISASAPALNVAGSFTVCKGQALTYTATGADTYTWSSGATSSTIALSHTATASYSIVGTNTVNGCRASRSFTVQVAPCTGIDQPGREQAGFILYPNPGQAHVTIETDRALELTAYNQLGELVLELVLKAGKNAIDISHLSPGVYFLKSFNNGKDGKVSVTRFVRLD